MSFDEHTSPTRHWNDHYLDTSPTEVSWFEERPTTSLELIDLVARPPRPGQFSRAS